MGCKAITYTDGSWFCPECNIAGDRDEDVSEHCRLREAQSAEKDSQPAKGH